MTDALGLDIGGANLKAAHSRGDARTAPFALWKKPEGLTSALRELIRSMPPHDILAVTMTGELCDCFVSKREGVEAILESVERVSGRDTAETMPLFQHRAGISARAFDDAGFLFVCSRS